MKKHIKLLSAIGLLVMICSCGNTEKKATDKKVEKTSKRQTSTEIKYAEANKLKKKLRQTQPVSADDFEDWIPKTFGGLILERTKSLGMYGEDVAMAGWYKRKDNKIIILYIYDAAGPDGTMIADKINVLGAEKEYDVESQQHRSVSVKGRMARQIHETEKNMTIISFFHKKRFMIMVMAHDHSIEETWNLVDELDFDTLDNLIK